MRRRPVAVYRVIDEAELLGQTGAELEDEPVPPADSMTLIGDAPEFIAGRDGWSGAPASARRRSLPSTALLGFGALCLATAVVLAITASPGAQRRSRSSRRALVAARLAPARAAQRDDRGTTTPPPIAQAPRRASATPPSRIARSARRGAAHPRHPRRRTVGPQRPATTVARTAPQVVDRPPAAAPAAPPSAQSAPTPAQEFGFER